MTIFLIIKMTWLYFQIGSWSPLTHFSYIDRLERIVGRLAIFFITKGLSGRWSRHWLKFARLYDMTFLKLMQVVVAILVQCPLLVNYKILFHIDNQVKVQIVNKQTSKSPEVMALVRILYLWPFDLTLYLRHITLIQG